MSPLAVPALLLALVQTPEDDLRGRLDAIAASALESGRFAGLVLGVRHAGRARVYGYGHLSDRNVAPPEGMAAMHIDEGHFDDVKLDGLRWAGVYHWPGPLHEGNGTLLAVIDEKANEKQRQALLTILTGQEQSPGTFFQILSLIVSKLLPPKFAPIEFDFNLEKRTARVSVPGVFETVSAPIKNPVTKEDHRIRVVMPDGFEYKEAEIASAVVNKDLADLKYDWPGSHSSLAVVEHTASGLR